MPKQPTPCTQKQRRFILYLWSEIKLKDDAESMFKMIAHITQRELEYFGTDAGGVMLYENNALNLLTTGEAYKVAQGMLRIKNQNKARGTNVVIKSRSEFAQNCKYCGTPIYWGVASQNERIPLEIIDQKHIWHNCKNKSNK